MLMQIDLFTGSPTRHGFPPAKKSRRIAPRGSSASNAAARTGIIDHLAGRCIKNQSREWWDHCVEVAHVLLTHNQFCPGSYLTTTARRLSAMRGIELEPTTHNAWNSAIRVLFTEFAVPIGRVIAVTPQTHDTTVVQWKSAIYNPRATPPDWYTAVMQPLKP